jgi:hypothetical protein
MAVTGLHSGKPKILYNTINVKGLIERIVVLVYVQECLATHKNWGKSIFQARPTGPLLQRLPLNSLKSPFLGFWVILRNLTDFRKTVETGMDPRLDCLLKLKQISQIQKKTFREYNE